MRALTDRLHALEAELHGRGIPIRQIKVPGRPEVDIRDAMDAFGLSVPQELLEWWQWSDGFDVSRVPSPIFDVMPHGLVPVSLEQAIQRRREDNIEGDLFGIRDDWLKIAHSGHVLWYFGHVGKATDLMPVTQFVLGDANMPEELDQRTFPSLSVYVDWALDAVRSGAWTPNAEGRWDFWDGGGTFEPWR